MSSAKPNDTDGMAGSSFVPHSSKSARTSPMTIRLDELRPRPSSKTAEKQMKITNVREIASYNWLNSPQPSIVLPGLPPRWTPLKSAAQLKEDRGEYFRDQNAARYPKYPMEPAVRAVLNQGTKDWSKSVQVFACGSTLGNLLRFTRNQPKPFHIRVEVVGKTVFLIRKEAHPTQLIEGIYGYGHSFPEAYTTWDAPVTRSESHQRVICYSFGQKEIMVRFEADGYLVEESQAKPKLPNSNHTAIGELGSLLEGLQTKPAQPQDGDLRISSGGHVLPHATLFDLKTRSVTKIGTDVIGQELTRLWLNQIPNFILAFHRRGRFDDIRIHDVRDRVTAWENSHQVELLMFSELLSIICKTAADMADSRMEVSYTTERGLQLRGAEGQDWTVMAPQLKREWVGA